MLLVKTNVAQSPIEGLGLFADQFISKGTVVWEFEPGLDILIDKNKLVELPSVARDYLQRYAYLNGRGEYVLCFDNAKYFNHSFTPNTRNMQLAGKSEMIDIACQDIQSGDEITTNYMEFDAQGVQKLGCNH